MSTNFTIGAPAAWHDATHLEHRAIQRRTERMAHAGNLTVRCRRPIKKGSRSFPCNTGAGKESRTLDLNLGKVALYQLSYSRISHFSESASLQQDCNHNTFSKLLALKIKDLLQPMHSKDVEARSGVEPD